MTTSNSTYTITSLVTKYLLLYRESEFDAELLQFLQTGEDINRRFIGSYFYYFTSKAVRDKSAINEPLPPIKIPYSLVKIRRGSFDGLTYLSNIKLTLDDTGGYYSESVASTVCRGPTSYGVTWYLVRTNPTQHLSKLIQKFGKDLFND